MKLHHLLIQFILALFMVFVFPIYFSFAADNIANDKSGQAFSSASSDLLENYQAISRTDSALVR